MRTLLLSLVLIVMSTVASAQEERGVGYPTVAAALEALKARSDVKISEQGGWTIVDDRPNNTFWSFAPSGHPAYPAVVKRTMVTKDGNLGISMTALCQAGKNACDKLMAEFQALNEKMGQSIRDKSKSTQLPASEIDVQRLGEDAFRLVLKSFRSRSVDAGLDELLPKAQEACGEKFVGFGKYQFEMSEAINPASAKPEPFILRQEISCGNVASPRPPAVSLKNKDTQWRPTASQAQLVERQTYAYFSAKDAGRYQEAYSLLSPAQKDAIPFARWTALTEKFNTEAGKVQSRAIKKITWYKDPPGVTSGVYAATDFSSQFANVEIHCGYVVWHEQANGSFLLVREEQNSISKETQQKLKPGELEKIRSEFGC